MARYIRNYEVLRELGRGRFGRVWLAVGEVPARGLLGPRRRLVAIKELRDRSSAEGFHLLRQEFALLDQVKHRSIVRVFELLELERAVVMEYVHGVTLRKVLEVCESAHEQVFTDAVIELGCELADALHQAYTTPGDNGEPLGLVHRDLKPENVILTPQGDVKVLDFGLARVANADFAREDPRRIRGTPLYMAPEQALGRPVDHRTDLFALGLILYELLLGRPAYRVPGGPDALERAYQAIERAELGEQLRELEEILPELGAVVARCLRPRPEDRYQWGQDLLVDLRSLLYRGRGSHLREFADFFYGQLHHLPDPPSVEELGEGPAPAAGSPLQDRLRASMEREATARAVSASLHHGEDSPPEPRSQRGGGGDGAAENPRRERRVVGARSPDETGMLEVMPLRDEEGGPSEVEDPSATTFFALPPPRVEPRPSPQAAAAPPPAQAAPAAPAPAAATPPPPAAPAAAASAPNPTPLVRGPVVSGPVSSSSTPFAAQQQPPPPADAPGRVRSWRIYALFLGLFALVGAALVTAVWLGLHRVAPSGPGGTATSTAPTTSPAVPSSSSPSPANSPGPAGADEDVALGYAEEPPPPPSSRRRSGTSSSGKRAGGSTSSSGASSRTPAGKLVVKVTDGSPVFSIELVCPSGFRKRVPISGGQATFTGVPAESCDVFFKGGVAAKFTGARGGQVLSCSIQGSTAVCR